MEIEEDEGRATATVAVKAASVCSVVETGGRVGFLLTHRLCALVSQSV